MLEKWTRIYLLYLVLTVRCSQEVSISPGVQGSQSMSQMFILVSRIKEISPIATEIIIGRKKEFIRIPATRLSISKMNSSIRPSNQLSSKVMVCKQTLVIVSCWPVPVSSLMVHQIRRTQWSLIKMSSLFLVHRRTPQSLMNSVV